MGPRWVLGVVGAFFATALIVVGLQSPAQGSDQLTWFADQNLTHGASKYAQPTVTSLPSWTSPVDYAGGRVHLRFEVTSKPSDKPLQVQICVWRNSYAEETCSPTRDFSSTGVHWFDMGTPSTWWKKNGSWSWSAPFSPVRLMIKDKASGKLLMTGSCGTSCYQGTDIAQHTPIRIRAGATVTPAGQTFSPPASWVGCPVAWSPACAAGATTTTTGATVSTTTTTTTTTTAAPPTGQRDVVLVIANARWVAVPDARLRDRLSATGHRVTVVSDEALTSAVLDGADLVVLSNSVDPAQMSSLLVTAPVPVLSNDPGMSQRLRLGAGSSTLTGQSSIQVVGGSPLDAGLAGRQKIATTGTSVVTLGAPAPGGQVVARSLTNRPAVVAYETGAELTTGTSPARRVASFLGYPTPRYLNASGWAMFDAWVAWLTAPTTDAEAPTGSWQHPELGFRTAVAVDPGAAARSDLVVDLDLDLDRALASAGENGPVDPATIRVVEVDGAGEPVDDVVPHQFDAEPAAARGTLAVLLEGPTAAGEPRRYHVYYDVAGTGVTTPTFTPLVSVRDGVVDEGQPSLEIRNLVGTWLYHEQGGGFSSIVDTSGQDWLNYSTAPGSAGAYRGLPNAVYPAGHFHPGATTSTTTIRAVGPLKVTFESVTADGWRSRWVVYPDVARMTMLQAPTSYWFLYEGTPGGQIDLTTDRYLRSDGADTPLSQAVEADAPDPEWVAFADRVRDRSIFLVHHADDALTDSYWLMEDNMTVFGFGRGRPVSRYLTGTHTFTVGLVDADDVDTIRSAAHEQLVPATVAVGGTGRRD